MVFSSSVFAAEKEQSAWDSFLGLFSAKTAATSDVGVEYRGHIQNVGNYPLDGSWIQGPTELGTEGKGLRLEGFWIQLDGDVPADAHIEYQVHVQNVGWMDPVQDGEFAGTEGRSLQIEAIKISLVDDEGELLKDYSVVYSGHVQNVGDVGPYTNGEQLGTVGSFLRLEAIEVEIVQNPADLTAYEAALAAVTETNYTVASWTAYEAVVAANVVTEDNLQSEVDAATAAITAAQADLVEVPVIAGMTATGQKAITVTGTQLDNLKIADLAVAGNTVTSITPSADGTSAVVALGTDLAPETNTIVTATIDGVAKDYTVNYTIAGKTVSIVAKSYDDDTLNQALTVLVDGVETTPAYLTLAGYTVAFNAWDENDASANAMILGAVGGNATGVLSNAVPATPMTIGNYTVQVTISKGSTIVTSEKAGIKILDLNNNTSAITAYEITNGTTAIMKSSTLVLGETADITSVTVGVGSAAAELSGYVGYTVSTSNSAIVAVNTTTGTMTATGIGTANVTITAGQVTKVIPITVTGTPRAATKVTPAASSITYIIGGSAVNTMNVTLTDQYGDPMPGITITGAPATATTPQVVVPAAVTALTATPGATDAKGVSAVALAAATTKGQTGAVIFKNNKGATIGSFSVTTTDNTSTTTAKLEYDPASTNKTNNINTDLISQSTITFKVGLYNSSGAFNLNLNDLFNYRVMFNNNIISITDNQAGTTDTSGDCTFVTSPAAPGAAATFTVNAVAAGTTTMQVFNDAGNVIDTRVITVSAAAPYITAVSFKVNPTIDYGTTLTYKDVLTYTDSINDDIIKGVTLSNASAYDIRIDETGVAPSLVGDLYLDKNNDGVYTPATDTVIGRVAATVSADATGGLVAGTVTDGVVGSTFVAPAKGTVTFSVQDLVSASTPVVGTSGIVVNAK